MNGYVNGSGATAGWTPAAAPMLEPNSKTQHTSQSNAEERASIIVRFAKNVPQEVALSRRQPDNPLVQSDYGEQVLFFLTGGRRMYVEPIVASMMAELGIRPEEPFTICKGEGPKPARGKRPIAWHVERVAAPIPPQSSQTARSQDPNRAERAVPTKIPYDIAFREILAFVTGGLKDAGEQWSDEAKQGMVSTILINASREGVLATWTRKWETTPAPEPAPIATSGDAGSKPAAIPPLHPNPSWNGIDTGPFKPGTTEAQAYVAQRKIAELQKDPPPANPTEMRQAFKVMREELGEVRYFQELSAVGIADPSQLPPSRARDLYRRMLGIAYANASEGVS